MLILSKDKLISIQTGKKIFSGVSDKYVFSKIRSGLQFLQHVLLPDTPYCVIQNRLRLNISLCVRENML